MPEQSTDVYAAIRGIQGIDGADAYISMELNGKRVYYLIDSGCEVTMVPLKLAEQAPDVHIKPSTCRLLAPNGTAFRVTGEIELPMTLGSRRVVTHAFVSPDPEDITLGADWLRRHSCRWDFGNNPLRVDGCLCTPLSKKAEEDQQNANSKIALARAVNTAKTTRPVPSTNKVPCVESTSVPTTDIGTDTSSKDTTNELVPLLVSQTVPTSAPPVVPRSAGKDDSPVPS